MDALKYNASMEWNASMCEPQGMEQLVDHVQQDTLEMERNA